MANSTQIIQDTPLQSVDVMASVADTDDFIVRTTVGGKAKIRRASTGLALDHFLASLGLCLDNDGTICADVD